MPLFEIGNTVKNTGRTWFKKGQPAWNKGKKRWWKSPTEFKKGHIPWLKEKHLSEEAKEEIKQRLKQQWIKNLKGGLKGKHHSEETKRKIGEANKISLKGKISNFKGKKMSIESRRKLSESHKWQKGQLSSGWIDGRSKDMEHKRKQLKAWRHKNPLKWKTYCHRRRSLMKDLTLEIVQMVYEDNVKKYGTLTCYLCENPVLFGKDCLEHKTPLSRGGTNRYENLAVAHRSCNNKKRGKTEEEYRRVQN